MKKLLFLALLLASLGAQAQTVNEAIIRQQINAVLTTNANKQITASAQRQLMNLMVTWIRVVDSTDRANVPAQVRTTTLTGLSTASAAAITSSSTVLQAAGQLQAQSNIKTTFIKVNTVADIVPYLPVSTMTTFYVASDIVRFGGNSSRYDIWPDGTAFWFAVIPFSTSNLLTP